MKILEILMPCSGKGGRIWGTIISREPSKAGRDFLKGGRIWGKSSFAVRPPENPGNSYALSRKRWKDMG